MSNDDFTQKEVIQQLLVEMRALHSTLNEHKTLITQQSSLNQGRDTQIETLAVAMKELQIEMRTMRIDYDEKMNRVNNELSFFIWKVSFIASGIAAAGAFVINWLLGIFNPF